MLFFLNFLMKSMIFTTLILLSACDLFVSSKKESVDNGAEIKKSSLPYTSKKVEIYRALYRGQLTKAKLLVATNSQNRDTIASYTSIEDPCFALTSLIYEEDWNEAIRIERPKTNTPSCIIITHLGKGAAYAANGNFLAARSEIKALNKLKKSLKKSPEKHYLSFSSYFLIGFLRFQQKQYNDTIRILKRAYRTEEKFPRHNPFSWVFNSLYYTALGYEATGRPQAAVKLYRKILSRWPGMERAEKRLIMIEENKKR